jgi:hypothetical protein
MLNSRIADITATDHHPEANAYLQLNVALNEGRCIPFVCAGWEQGDTSLREATLSKLESREPLINVHFRHHGVRDAPEHVRPCRNAASLVLTKMLYKSELP